MERTVRVVMCAHQISLGNPIQSVAHALNAIYESAKMNPDIIVLPKLSLTGASCGKLLTTFSVMEACQNQIKLIASKTKNIASYLIISTPVKKSGRISNFFTVLYRGQTVAVIDSETKDFAVFSCSDVTFAVCGGDPRSLPVHVAACLNTGVDILINPSAIPVSASTIEDCRNSALEISRTYGCGVCICNGNIGESSAPFLYKSFCGIFECGEQLAWQIEENGPFQASADLDADIILSQKLQLQTQQETFGKHTLNKKTGLLRDVRQNPYLPADCRKQIPVIEELFDLQVRALAGRLQNAGIQKTVIGCSGGLDSTLALLAASSAMRRLNLPRENIIAITMPGFGTTDRTYQNALKLIEGVGASKREIPIADSVLQHFRDIGQPAERHDITYENAQARERTQILFDIANMENALVIGTGDLSEAALGWCTFGGDQFANFNVNACITKTMARLIVEFLTGSAQFIDVSDILKDILLTPVSPELLPDDGSGQHTEKILGDYILHDFYLYYFTKYGMSPSKIYEYACHAFIDHYTPAEIYQTLALFIQRFFAGQFKRASAPETSVISSVCLAPSSFMFPSDASPEFLLQELRSSVNR